VDNRTVNAIVKHASKCGFSHKGVDSDNMLVFVNRSGKLTVKVDVGVKMHRCLDGHACNNYTFYNLQDLKCKFNALSWED
jgi:tRNA(Phe) wybutosine-synthesizing methylase Tyw3